MLHHHQWASSLAKLLRRAGSKVLDFFRVDMTETKWGHRVMDQIFREGKFEPHHTEKAPASRKKD
jgi:hypothetical protein